MNERHIGLYIHIPFCVKKCNYCAFLSFDAESSPRKEYLEALIREIELRGEQERGAAVDTIYIGGGTPSVMDVSQLSLIMKAMRESFDVSPDAEITIEANPGTLGRTERVTRTKLQAYRYMGANRLSMGVQSMDNDRLRLLGRIHTAEDVIRDLRFAREAGFQNINLDLIFSVPGETSDDAARDAEMIAGLGPEHISLYSLQIEEGTPFFEMAERGEIKEVPDEEDRDTYHRLCRIMRDAGYEHYEISNFAKPGYRSRHNSGYWNMTEYIGLGLGASGFTGGRRYRNTEDMASYLAFFGSSSALRIPLVEEHENDSFDNISEAVFTGLRRREGITYEEAIAAYRRGTDGRSDPGTSASEEFWRIFKDARKEADQFADQGFLVIDDERLRLTEKGIDISNRIMALFV